MNRRQTLKTLFIYSCGASAAMSATRRAISSEPMAEIFAGTERSLRENLQQLKSLADSILSQIRRTNFPERDALAHCLREASSLCETGLVRMASGPGSGEAPAFWQACVDSAERSATMLQVCGSDSEMLLGYGIHDFQRATQLLQQDVARRVLPAWLDSARFCVPV